MIAAGTAHAQKAHATAELAYEQAKQLAEAGDYAAACPLFETSYKADPQVGVQLNLADCYEHLGRLATAWAMFRDAANVAQNRGDDRREEYARKRADALMPRLSKLRVGKPPAGVSVALDGADVTALAGADMPVDPGDHELVATQPGHVARTTKIAIAADGATQRVEVAELELEPEKPLAAGATGAVSSGPSGPRFEIGAAFAPGVKLHGSAPGVVAARADFAARLGHRVRLGAYLEYGTFGPAGDCVTDVQMHDPSTAYVFLSCEYFAGGIKLDVHILPTARVDPFIGAAPSLRVTEVSYRANGSLTSASLIGLAIALRAGVDYHPSVRGWMIGAFVELQYGSDGKIEGTPNNSPPSYPSVFGGARVAVAF